MPLSDGDDPKETDLKKENLPIIPCSTEPYSKERAKITDVSL